MLAKNSIEKARVLAEKLKGEGFNYSPGKMQDVLEHLGLEIISHDLPHEIRSHLWWIQGEGLPGAIRITGREGHYLVVVDYEWLNEYESRVAALETDRGSYEEMEFIIVENNGLHIEGGKYNGRFVTHSVSTTGDLFDD